MFIQKYKGKTLKELTEITHIFNKVLRVFVLDGEDDDTGRHLIDCFSVQQVIDQIPALADARVVLAENFYGETILRIAAP